MDHFKGIPLRTDVGNLIENAVFIQLHINFPEVPLKYWRTLAKAEVDFILEREKDLVPIEIKYANL